MAEGQLAVNTAAASTGLFFKDSTGALVKTGPVHIGTTAPNADPAEGGQAGNSVGEAWLDTTGTNALLKIWDGSVWKVVQPVAAGDVVSTSDTGTVTSTMIADGTIVDADVNASAAIAGTKISPDFGSQNVVTTGTSTAASLIPTGSSVPTNGVYLPAANSVGISTNGAHRVRVDSTGNVGIGVLSPGARLHVANDVGGAVGRVLIDANVTSGYDSKIEATNIGLEFTAQSNNRGFAWNIGATPTERMRLDSSGRLGLGTSNPDALLTVNGVGAFGAGTSALPSIARSSDLDTGAWFPAANTIAVSTGGTERARIDSSGRLLVGTTSTIASPDTNGTQRNPWIQLAGASVATTLLSHSAFSGSPGSNSTFQFTRSNTLTIGDHGLADNNDRIGTLQWSASDGSQYIRAAQISAAVDGVTGQTASTFAIGTEYRILTTGTTDFTLIGAADSDPGTIFTATDVGTGTGTAIRTAGDMPGRLVFSTTPDNTGIPVERMRLTSAGNLGIGFTAPVSPLHIRGTGDVVRLETSGPEDQDGVSLRFHQRDTTISADQGYGGIEWEGNDSDNAGVRGYIKGFGEGTSGQFGLRFATQGSGASNPTERMRLDSSGRLGLGTSSPATDLHIVSGEPELRMTDSDGTNQIGRFKESNGIVILSSQNSTSNGGYRFQQFDGTTTTTPLTIDSAGQVGIGTTSPSSLLHLADAGDITVGTTTGTKIGTATTQKLGFYNATPVVQPTAVADATDAATAISQLNALLAHMRTLGLIAT
jgi:hypothetical protein